MYKQLKFRYLVPIAIALAAASPNGAMAASNPKSQAMKVLTPANLPAVEGPPKFFTGSVKVVALVKGEAPSSLESAAVTFQPGARSAWHTHPKGQLLVVTDGVGLIQEFGQPIRKIKSGDVIWTPPGVQHWHGASSASSMTHIANQESLNGSPVKWLQKVTDEEYNASID